MKAIRVHEFGGPEVLKLEEVPDPQPGPDQVLVRVRAIGVNPVETYLRSGKYPILPTLPLYARYGCGRDGRGDRQRGERNFRIGDRVYVYGSVTGTYAELALCTQAQVHPLPEKVSFEQGASIGVPVGAAWRALFHRGQAKPGRNRSGTWRDGWRRPDRRAACRRGGPDRYRDGRQRAWSATGTGTGRAPYAHA